MRHLSSSAVLIYFRSSLYLEVIKKFPLQNKNKSLKIYHGCLPLKAKNNHVGRFKINFMNTLKSKGILTVTRYRHNIQQKNHIKTCVLILHV